MSTIYRVTCDGCPLDVTVQTKGLAEALAADHYCRAEPSRAEPSRAEPSRAEPSRAEPSRAEPSRAEVVGDCTSCSRRGVKVSSGWCRLCRIHDDALTIQPRTFDPEEPSHTCPRCGITLPGSIKPGRLGYCRACLYEARKDGVVDFKLGRSVGYRPPQKSAQ